MSWKTGVAAVLQNSSTQRTHNRGVYTGVQAVHLLNSSLETSLQVLTGSYFMTSTMGWVRTKNWCLERLLDLSGSP